MNVPVKVAVGIWKRQNIFFVFFILAIQWKNNKADAHRHKTTKKPGAQMEFKYLFP